MTSSERTPLWAAGNERQSVVKQFLEAGAEIESSIWAPLSWAAENGHQAVVKQLLKAKANVESTDVRRYLGPSGIGTRP